MSDHDTDNTNSCLHCWSTSLYRSERCSNTLLCARCFEKATQAEIDGIPDLLRDLEADLRDVRDHLRRART